MKKITVLSLAAALALFSAALAAADLNPASMRVQVEGEDEAKVVTIQAMEASSQAKDSPVIIVRRPVKSKSAAAIKELAAKSELENEVMDSLIAKMSDMETELDRQRAYNIAALAAFLLVLAAVYFTRRKK